MTPFMWIVISNLIVLSSLFAYFRITSYGDVHIVPGKFKVKKKEIKEGDRKLIYYTLHVFIEDFMGVLPLYQKAGDIVINECFGYEEDFIEYKFNSVSDAVKYCEENIL